jgi:hypothetical protein
VRFPSQNAGDDDARTRAVVARIQRDGVIWAGGSMWHGQAVLRLSVSGWPTTAADIDRSVAAVLSAAAATA